MINLILFGKPGSGKGTQAEFVKQKYDLIHISTGDVRDTIFKKIQIWVYCQNLIWKKGTLYRMKLRLKCEKLKLKNSQMQRVLSLMVSQERLLKPRF